MLLRSSITTTKKFFQKTLKNFKYLFSSGYQRLPQTPTHKNLSYSVAATNVMDMNNNNKNNTSYQELEKFYTDFTDQWESENEKEARRRRMKKKAPILSSPTKQEHEVVYNGSYMKLSNASPSSQLEKRDQNMNKRRLNLQRGKQKDSSLISKDMKERNYCMVEEKMRELEKLDMSNVDYVMDIEEVLHFYSKLTCPAYLEIVDKFFMEMYSELFGPAWLSSTPCSVKSRQKLRYQ